MINPKIWTFTLDVKKRTYLTNITPKQGDIQSNIFRVNLTQDSSAYNLAGLTVRAYFKRPDGAVSFIDGEVTASEQGGVDITLTNQVLNHPGKALCEILVIGTAGESLSAVTFEFEILPSLNYNEVESSNEFNALVTALTAVNTALSEIEGIIDDIGSLSSLSDEFHAHVTRYEQHINNKEIHGATNESSGKQYTIHIDSDGLYLKEV